MSDLINSVSSAPKNLGNSRVHEIDWLRAIAFLLLIFYHIGMLYVADWGWHVKSNYQSEGLKLVMQAVNPWRMPLIFFLSGFALCLIEPKVSLTKLVKLRFIRLFIPLIFGMYVIVVPQAYFEAVQKYGFDQGFLAFWQLYLSPNIDQLEQMIHSPLGLLTWNHLWYLAYLWHYTLAYALLKPILTTTANWLNRRPVYGLLWFIWLSIVLSLFEFYLVPIFPKTHALVDDWYNHARYFSIFLCGYFVAKIDGLYTRVVNKLIVWWSAAIPLWVISLAVHYGYWLNPSFALIEFLTTLLFVTSALCWLFGLVAFAGRFLTFHNAALSYLNKAVLPWYILHQTITIIIAMWLANFALGGLLEPSLLIVGTLVSLVVLFAIIKRVNLLRFIFGMKGLRKA